MKSSKVLDTESQVVSLLLELLQTEACVIFPSLGAFVLTAEPSHQEGDVYLPPVKKLSLNPRLTQNDGLLAGQVAHRLHWTYKQSLDWLEQWSAQARRRLQEGQATTLLWQGLGQFSLDAQGLWLFEPERHNDAAALWGLSPVAVSFLKRETAEPQILAATTLAASASTLTESKHAARKLWAWGLGLSAALSGLSLLFYYSPWKNPLPENGLALADSLQNATSQASTTLVEPFAEPKDSTTAQADTLPTQTDSLSADFTTTQSNQEPETQQGYLIVIGVFSKSQNAERRLQSLKSRGYAARMETTYHGYFRVLITLPCQASELKERLAELRRNVEPKAWVYEPETRLAKN